MDTTTPTAEVVRNYSKCPLKKRPVMLDEPIVEVEVVLEEVDDEDEDVEVVNGDDDDDDDDNHVVDIEEQCEPENLSTKPEDLSRAAKLTTDTLDYIKFGERIYVPKPTYPPTANTTVIKEESADIYPMFPSDYRNWSSPLTPPITYPITNENTEIWPHHRTFKLEPSAPQPPPPPPLHPYSIPTLYKPYTNATTTASSSSSLDLRTIGLASTNLYTHHIPSHHHQQQQQPMIKSEVFTKRFTPYRVDRPVAAPLFNIFPLSPASSQASSYKSYESPRRSVSPVSTNSSLSENMPSNYSVFQPMPAISSPPHHNHHHPSSSTATISSTTSDHCLTSASSSSSSSLPSAKKEKAHKSAHYQCPDCSKSYSTYSGLSKHLQFHCPAVEGNQAKKHFSCKNCEKVYTSLGALKMHIRTHTLPCKCDICGKAFSRPWLLQGHIRTHTGEKPFTCQHCHRAFADRSNLRAHLQTHSEIKKYSCTTCAKTFSRMSLLTKHMEVGCPGGAVVTSPPPPLHHHHHHQLQQHPYVGDIPVY